MSAVDDESERIPVRVFSITTRQQFEAEVYPARQPAVIKGVDLGRAPAVWSPEYLCAKCGGKPVKVHVSPVPQMDFVNKNFAYKTLAFDELLRRASRSGNPDNHFICPEEKYYLRSLGDDPRKDIADFRSQFPMLEDDLRLPMFFPPERHFSSVLRVGSAGVQLWTHYDVMDNLLVQVTGRKRVVLFPPSAAPQLYLVGDKSQVLDIDSADPARFPLFNQAQRYECFLEAGDILFIPALWFHNVVSLQFGIAVNVFWKHLDDRFYDAKDTYGNKDPPQVQRAFQIADRALKALEELPLELQEFYGQALLTRIEKKLFKATTK